MSRIPRQHRTYRAVHHYFAHQTTRGILLDIPCGNGVLSHQLQCSGFDVVSADIFSDVVKTPGLTFLQADLNATLPFANNTFDHIACVEGIEHLENPFRTVRELRRMIKKGGKLVITTPNIQSLGSRFRFFMTGGFNYFQRPYHRKNRRHGVFGHINAISLYEMMFILSDAGFRIERVFTDASHLAHSCFVHSGPWSR